MTLMKKKLICTLLAILGSVTANASKQQPPQYSLDGSGDSKQPSKRDSLAVATDTGFTPIQSSRHHHHHNNYVQAPHLLQAATTAAGSQPIFSKDNYPSSGVQILPSHGIKLGTVTQQQLAYAPQDGQKLAGYAQAGPGLAYQQLQLAYNPQQQQMYAIASPNYAFAQPPHRFSAPYGQAQPLSLPTYAASPANTSPQSQYAPAQAAVPAATPGLGAYGNAIFASLPANYLGAGGLLSKLYTPATGGHFQQQSAQQPAYAFSIQPSVLAEQSANKQQIASHIPSAVTASQLKPFQPLAVQTVPTSFSGPPHGGPGAQSYASFALQSGSPHSSEKPVIGAASSPVSHAQQYYIQAQPQSSPAFYAGGKSPYQFSQPIVAAAASQNYYNALSFPSPSTSGHHSSPGPYSSYNPQPASSSLSPKYAFSPVLYQPQFSHGFQPHHHHQSPHKYSAYY